MDKKEIASRLRKARGNRTRKEVADALGIAYSTLNMYEFAQRVPKDEIKRRIADFYGMSIEELFY